MPDPQIKNPDHQVVHSFAEQFAVTNKLVGGGGPPDPYPGAHLPPFQNDDEKQNWMARRRAAEAHQANRRIPITVSPDCHIKLPGGRIARSGEEVGQHELPAGALLLLLDRLVLIKIDNADGLTRNACSENWRYRVASGQAIVSRTGIVDAHGEVTENDFEGGLSRIDELVDRGVLVRNPKAAGAP